MALLRWRELILSRVHAAGSLKRRMPVGAGIVLLALGWSMSANAEYFVPTRLGGSINYGFSYGRIGLSESEQQNAAIVIHGNGYFWQPWFMTAGASISLGVSSSESNSGAGSAGKTVGGSLDFNLFPESRFPTNFGFSVSDSRQEIQESPVLPGQAYQSRRFYVRQTYNGFSGANVSAWFFQNSSVAIGQKSASGDLDEESVDRNFGFQVIKHMSYQDFNFSGNYFSADPALSSISTSNFNLMFTHSYIPNTEMGINSVSTYTNAQTNIEESEDFNFSYGQVASSFSWRPEHRPYSVSGGVSLYSSGENSRGVSTNTSASYRIARNINASAGLGVNSSSSDGRQSIDSSLGGAVSMYSDQYSFFGFEYSWNGSTGVSNSISRSDGGELDKNRSTDSQSLNVNGGHQLSRGFNLGRSASASFAFGQGAGASRSSASKDIARSLSNSSSINWSHAGFGGNTVVSFSASDSRNFGKHTSEFQVFNGQLSRAQEITRLSTLSGSVGYSASRSKLSEDIASGAPADADPERISRSASASFNYSHGRFFGIHGMLYNSQLSFPNLLPENKSSVQASGREWNNSLSYRVGLLSLSMTARLSELGDGGRALSASFSAIRSF